MPTAPTAAVPALAFAAYAGGYGLSGPDYAGGPYADDGYYDDHFRSSYGNYWGDKGSFYHRSGANDRRYRRVQQHFKTVHRKGRIYSATGDDRMSFIDAADIAPGTISVVALTTSDFANSDPSCNSPHHPGSGNTDEVAQALPGMDAAIMASTSNMFGIFARASAKASVSQLREQAFRVQKGRPNEALLLPGACSLHPHIALIEAGLPYSLIHANLQDRTTASGENLDVVSPKGYVPVLELEDGSRLTEGGAIAQWIADQTDPGRLAPRPGTRQHYEFLEWLFFISVELHKNIGSMFNPLQTGDWRSSVEATLTKRLSYLDRQIAGKQYLLGDHFTVIDGYLFNVLFWSRLVKLDLSRWPAVESYVERLRQRPSVVQALAEEDFSM